MRRFLALTVLALAIGAIVVAKPDAPADVAKVSVAIDRYINDRLAADKITASGLTDDAEFMRRLYLDLTGTIPTSAQALAFLDSKEPNKRARLIDELLASRAYGQHFAVIWRNLIIRPDANMIRPPNTQPLVDWLAEKFNSGTGWDRIVTELLTVEGNKPESLFFILNGDTRGYPQANIVAGTIGQLFMGTQLACAECHNHPFVETWKQTDFWGVAAFFGKVQNVGVGKGGKVGTYNIAETTKGVLDKKRNLAPKIGPGASIVIPDSSFKQIGKVVKARLPHGPEPDLKRDEPFRPAFVKWLTAKDNPYFAANIVNRTWAHLFGKGFANPVGEVSYLNPPSHPELSAYLAKELAAHDFDLKFLIRAICNSTAYQRTSRPVPGNANADKVLFARQEMRLLTPEVLYNSLTQALEVKDLVAKAAKGGAGKKKANANAAKTALPGAKQQFLEFYTTKDLEGDATEYSHGIPQALRLMNQDLFNTGGNALPRLLKLSTPEKIIEGMYLTVLSRRPSALELREGTEHAAKARSREEGYRAVFWSLLNSAEFILNH